MRSIGALMVAAVMAGRSGLPQATPPAPDLSRTEISIESRVASCNGCPESRVTFRGNGTAQFECLSGCAVPGTQYAPYPQAEFATLAVGIQAARFFDIPRLSDTFCLHCVRTTLTYRDERRIHEVVIVGRSDSGLDALRQQLADAARIFAKYAAPSAANYQQLLSEGWSPNDTLAFPDLTMLNFAVIGGDADAVKSLLEHGARLNRDALESASSPAMLELLWTAAQVSADSPTAQALLRRAAGGNWVQNIEWLLAKRVDINAKDSESGRTALMMAAESGYESAVAILLAKGARVDLRDAAGNQALWFGSSRDSSPSVLALLLKQGLEVDDMNKEGRTPLMHAAESCARGPIGELLLAGADRTLKDHTGKAASDLVPIGHGPNQPESCARAKALLATK